MLKIFFELIGLELKIFLANSELLMCQLGDIGTIAVADETSGM